jgi:hypothetical protein
VAGEIVDSEVQIIKKTKARLEQEYLQRTERRVVEPKTDK